MSPRVPPPEADPVWIGENELQSLNGSAPGSRQVTPLNLGFSEFGCRTREVTPIHPRLVAYSSMPNMSTISPPLPVPLEEEPFCSEHSKRTVLVLEGMLSHNVNCPKTSTSSESSPNPNGRGEEDVYPQSKPGEGYVDLRSKRPVGLHREVDDNIMQMRGGDQDLGQHFLPENSVQPHVQDSGKHMTTEVRELRSQLLHEIEARQQLELRLKALHDERASVSAPGSSRGGSGYVELGSRSVSAAFQDEVSLPNFQTPLGSMVSDVSPNYSDRTMADQVRERLGVRTNSPTRRFDLSPQISPTFMGNASGHVPVRGSSPAQHLTPSEDSPPFSGGNSKAAFLSLTRALTVESRVRDGFSRGDSGQLSVDEDGDSQPIPSLGSVGHPITCGLPCKYFSRKRGCKDGALCTRCHLCPWRRHCTRSIARAAATGAAGTRAAAAAAAATRFVQASKGEQPGPNPSPY